MQKRAMSVAAFCLASLAFVACGDDGYDCDNATVREAQERLASELAGEISFVYETEKIVVPVVVKSKPEGCGLQVELTQVLNAECGTVFAGELEYDTAATPPVWDGYLAAVDIKHETSVALTLRPRSATIVEVKAVIEQSRSPLCNQQTLTGDIRPK